MTSLRLFLLLLFPGVTTLTANNTIPFQLAGKLIVIRAIVDGQSGNFILDTGAQDLVLNARYFNGKSSKKELFGVNGYRDGIRESFPDLEIETFYWKEVSALILPMPLLEDSYGIPIHGLLGSKLFRRYTLIIDYQKFEIELFPLDKYGENADFDQLDPPVEILPFKYKGRMPMITAQIEDENLNFVIDTGAEINIIEDKYEKKLTVHLVGQKEPGLGGIGKQLRSVTKYEISGFRVGGVPTNTMKMAFSDLGDLNLIAFGPMADGILGYEFLSRYRVGINFKKRKLYLWDNLDGLMVKGRE